MDMKWTREAQYLLSYPTGYMNQVAAVWNSSTFTSISVVDVATQGTACPPEAPEIVLQRQWYGAQLGCDCLGIFSPYITD